MTFNRPLTWILALLAAPAIALGQAADDPVDLRPIWEQGQTSRYSLTQTDERRIEVRGIDMGGPQDINSVIEGEVTWRVTRANADGGGEAEFTVDDLAVTITMPDGQTITVTRRGGGGNGVADSVRQYIDALVGATLEVTVADDGTISRIRGFRAVQQRAGEMGQTLDERYFTNMLQDLAALVGGRADRQPGASWRHQHEAPHSGGFGTTHYNTTYTLNGVEYIAGIPIAIITRDADMDFQPDLSDLPAEAPDVSVRVGETSHNAQLLFDLSRGEIVGSNSDQVLGLELSTSFGGESFTQIIREVSNTRLLRISED